MLGLALERAAAQPEKLRTPALAVITKDTSKEGIQKTVKALYETTKLGDKKTRHEQFEKATTAELKASKDPLIQLALKLRPLLKEAEERNERFMGRMELLKPKYMEALRAFRWSEVAMVFQSAMNALNPVMTVQDRLVDVLTTHTGAKRWAARARTSISMRWSKTRATR